MARVHIYNAGPSGIPVEVLEKAKSELVEFENSGMSIMEHSHRGKVYDGVHNQAIALIREMMQVPENYTILFLTGGASMQFSMVPYNLLADGSTADYINTGAWSQKAIKEAKTLYGDKINIAGTTEEDGKFFRIPKENELKLNPNAKFVHITTNNTIFCTQWDKLPNTGNVPMVLDMSSDILCRPFDWSKNIGIIYAGAQKNLGPSGVTLVIIRNDILEKCPDKGMTMMLYKTHAKENSLYNTPPTFAIYILKLCMEWVKANGGAQGMANRNNEKASLIYGTIDNNPKFFKSRVEKESRSCMNVAFNLPTEELEDKMIKEATKAGFVGIKGHRSVKGIRISMYNAVSADSIKKFTEFMNDFAQNNSNVANG